MINSKLIAAVTFTAALALAPVLRRPPISAARPYTKAPAYIEPIFNWSGFYIGGHIGGAWTNEQWINTANTTRLRRSFAGPGFPPAQFGHLRRRPDGLQPASHSFGIDKLSLFAR